MSHGDDQTTTQRLPVPSSVLASSPLPFAGEVGETATQEWLMTPPPCFTRSQTAPLASSPLENLLIEHPSMSVYLPRPTNTSAAIGRIFPRRVLSHPSPYSRSSPSVSPSSVLTPDENDDSPMREEVSNETGGQQVAVPQPRNRVAQRAAKLLQAIDVLRPAQKVRLTILDLMMDNDIIANTCFSFFLIKLALLNVQFVYMYFLRGKHHLYHS